MNRQTPQADGVVAVLVTYNPHPAELQELLAALAPQVRHAVIVDNASAVDVQGVLAQARIPNAELVRLPENLGLAFAQNIGIERALAMDARFLYLSDQDSLPTPTLVAELAAIWSAEQRSGATPVAAIGPASVDRRTGALSFFWRRGAFLPYRWRPLPGERDTPQPAFDVEFLIASGTLICVDALRRIGGMRSPYFIDHVDTEWCFRARAAGYRLLGAPGARLQHRLGDQVRRVWFLRWRNVAFHSPLRDYYMFRNTLLMLADTPMGPFWRLHMLGRLCQFAAYFLLIGQERGSRARLMWLGLRHGLRRIGGRLDTATRECRAVPATALEPGR